ncbi:MAG TPA: hypothetical protein VMU29_13815 [Smithella sp.]|nr:hypothetical protein [Smithella sp.]
MAQSKYEGLSIRYARMMMPAHIKAMMHATAKRLSPGLGVDAQILYEASGMNAANDRKRSNILCPLFIQTLHILYSSYNKFIIRKIFNDF